MRASIPRIVASVMFIACIPFSVFVACGDQNFSDKSAGGDSSAGNDAIAGDGATTDEGGGNVCDGFDAAGSNFAVDTGTAICVDGGFKKDLATDPQNCGRCGHDCLGGDCSAGICQPTTFYQEPNEGGTPAGGPGVYDVFAGNVYWIYPSADGGQNIIRSKPSDASSPPTDLTTIGNVDSVVVAIDSTGLYYGTSPDQGIHRVRSGTDTTLGTGGTSFGGVSSIALDDANIYVASVSGGVGVLAIAKADLTVTTLSSSENTPIDLVVDAPWLEWIDAPWMGMADAGSTLVRRQGSAMVAPTPIGSASGLTVDARRRLYWFDNNTDELMQLAEDDSTATPISLGSFTLDADAGVSTLGAHGIDVDGAQAFVGIPDPVSGNVTIVDFSLCGAKPVPLTPSLRMPGPIVQDATSLYWGEFGGAIRRLAK